MALNFSKTKFMKMYSKRKYSLLDYDSILYEDFWIEEITSGKLLGILLDKNYAPGTTKWIRYINILIPGFICLSVFAQPFH
jgi:hypothetical protein